MRAGTTAKMADEGAEDAMGFVVQQLRLFSAIKYESTACRDGNLVACPRCLYLLRYVVSSLAVQRKDTSC